MVSIIIDGNYLFHKTFGVFAGFGGKQPGEVLSSSAEKNMFMRKIMTDICYSLNQLPVSGSVIFCKDSRSWRKDLVIERAEYKASREGAKDEKVDWGSFFELMEEFGNFLELNGFIYSKAAGAEGDDLLWFWNKKLKDQGSNVIIFSGDKDSHQLVSNDDTWTVCWNANSKNNKITCAPGWKDTYLDKEEEISIFDVSFNGDDDRDKIKRLLASCVLEEVDTRKFIFEKILTGDKGDDVPSVFAHEKTPGKFWKITPVKAASIYDHFQLSEWRNDNLNDLWNAERFKDWVSGFVLRSLSYTDNAENRKEVSNNYEENARLVWLSEQVIPDDVMEAMEKDFSNKSTGSRKITTDKKIMIARSKWAGEEAPSYLNPFKYSN
jgi:5'-3' exonuclease